MEENLEKILVHLSTRLLKMIELITNHINIKYLLFFIAICFFINTAIIIILIIYLGRFSYIKKMDKFFLFPPVDYGIILNAYRAFTYGISFTFPNSLGKKVHKNIDLNTIPKKSQLPFKIFIFSFFSYFPFFVFSNIWFRINS